VKHPSIRALRAHSGRSAGLSLIEVLITLVVISAGLLAYVHMQRGIYREANLSGGRTAATELALAKIEDLRSFTSLYTTSGAFAFQDIDGNAGGRLSGGSLVMPSGNVTVDNITFNRTWTSQKYWITGINSPGTTTAPAGNPIATYKLVTVTITWTEQGGAIRKDNTAASLTNAQQLQLSSIVAGYDPKLVPAIFH